MKKRWAIAAWGVLLIVQGLAQPQRLPYLQLIEESQSGRYDTVFEDQPAIVDINSILRIQLNKQLIERAMFEMQGLSTGDERLAQLDRLNELLRYKVSILQEVNEILEQGSQTDLQIFARLAAESNRLIAEIVQDEALANEINLLLVSEYIEKATVRGRSYPPIMFILEVLERKAATMRRQFLSELGVAAGQDSGRVIYFRLGAFIKNRSGGRPVHVENFDTYDRESYSPIRRFSTPISQAEKEKLQENAELMTRLEGGLSTGIENSRLLIKAELREVFASFDAYKAFRETYTRMRERLSQAPEASAASRVLDAHFSQLEGVNRLYLTLSQAITQLADGLSPGSLSDEGPDYLAGQLQQVIAGAYAQFDEMAGQVGGEAGIAGKAELDSVAIQYEAFKDAAVGDIQRLRNFLADVQDLLNPFRRTRLDNERFTEQVSRYTAGNLPDDGYIELKYIGERKTGDEILIKAVLERGTDRERLRYEEKELYRRYLTLERVRVHVRMSGSLILANPYQRDETDQVSLENKYQFAPTYGIFLKWGSRKSHFYNDFVNLGLGLGFSSPDFNLDGTPEFGAGLMLTGLKDLISTGWAWNFGVDTPYFFFGFNIPFSIGGLPNVSTASSITTDF